MDSQQPALLTAADLKRTDSGGVMTEKGVGGNGVPAPELVFGRFVIEPNVALDPHVHSADTAAYCVRGSCSFRTGEALKQHYEMGPGDYMYIPADTLHTEATGADGVELVFARDRRGGQTTMADRV